MATRRHVSRSRHGKALRHRFRAGLLLAGALLLASPAPALTSTPAANERPRVYAAHVATSPGSPVEVVLAGRSGAKALAFTIVDGVDHGTLGPLGPGVCVLVDGSCSVVLRYTPDASGLGDSLTFVATDPRGRDSRPGTVTLVVAEGR
jgi:hypothetical protein